MAGKALINYKRLPDILDFLYYTGLGSKNSEGFGMFEVKIKKAAGDDTTSSLVAH